MQGDWPSRGASAWLLLVPAACVLHSRFPGAGVVLSSTSPGRLADVRGLRTRLLSEKLRRPRAGRARAGGLDLTPSEAPASFLRFLRGNFKCTLLMPAVWGTQTRVRGGHGARCAVAAWRKAGWIPAAGAETLRTVPIPRSCIYFICSVRLKKHQDIIL